MLTQIFSFLKIEALKIPEVYIFSRFKRHFELVTHTSKEKLVLHFIEVVKKVHKTHNFGYFYFSISPSSETQVKQCRSVFIPFEKNFFSWVPRNSSTASMISFLLAKHGPVRAFVMFGNSKSQGSKIW